MRIQKIVAALAAFALCAPASAQTAASYAQDGLIGQWDGIENAGSGVHDGNAAYWKDLSGQSGDFALFSGVASFAANGLHKDAAGIMATNVTAAARTGARTIEVVVSGLPASGWANTFFISAKQNVSVNNSAKDGKRGYFFSQSHAMPALTDKKVAQETIAVVYNETCTMDRTFYRDGAVPAGETYQNVWTAATAETMHIGGRTGFLTSGDAKTTGYTVHAIRLYNRVLSDAEIARNATIDQIRFFGASPDALPADEGKFALTAAADAGGTVSVDDGAPGTAALKEETIGSVQPATLIATPLPGWKFAGWSGEFAYVSEGTDATPSIVVEPTCGRTFRAAFERDPDAVGCDYVTNGLVGRWDGIENAGAGVHDATSALWADLSGRGGDFIVDAAVASFADNGLAKNASGICATNLLAYSGVGTVEGVVSGVPSSGWVNAVLLSKNQTLTFQNVATDQRQYFFDNANFAWQFQGRGNPVSICVTYAPVDNVPKGQDFYLDGDLQTSGKIANSTLYWNFNGSKASVGGRPGYATSGDATTKGYTVHAIRFYNRVLTAGEAAYNAAVDRRRFSGMPAEAFAYRLSEGDVQFQLRAWSDGRGGTVNDGTLAATAWTTFGTSQTAVFTAKPKFGWEFAGWTGDTNAIVSGSANTPTVTVSSAEGVAIQALFTQASRYVQSGLIGFWDAIDNAGFGRHDEAPTVWKDLTGICGDFTLQAGTGVFEADALCKANSGRLATKYPSRTDVRTIEAVVSDLPANGWTVPVLVSINQHISIRDQGEGKKRQYFFDYSHFGLETTERPERMTVTLLSESESSAVKVFVNGAEPQGDGYTTYWSWADGMSMGGRAGTSGNDTATVGYRIHAIRFYDRQLTDEQIRSNARMDAIRYFGEVEPKPTVISIK